MTHPVKTVTRQTTLRERRHCSRNTTLMPFRWSRRRNGGLVTKFDFLKTFAFTTGQMLPHYDELMSRTVGR